MYKEVEGEQTVRQGRTTVYMREHRLIVKRGLLPGQLPEWAVGEGMGSSEMY